MLFKILESVPGGTLSREAVHLLNTFLDLGLKIPEKEEKVVVCKAVREMKRFLVHEGEKKGLQKGEDRIILSMLRRKSTPEQVHQLTGVPLDRIIAIATAKRLPVMAPVTP